MRMYVRGVPSLKRPEQTMHAKVNNPPSQDSFFFKAFNDSIDIANNVVKTKYLTAMKQGTLNPQDFGCLTVQDAYYCYRAAETLTSLLCKIDKDKDPELYDLANSKCVGYIEYNTTFFKDWHLSTSSCITPTENFRSYAEHEHNVMCAYAPIYTLVAMLPCYYLWPWFGKQIKQSSDYKPGVYESWFDGCWDGDTYFDSAYDVGNFIEEWKNKGKEFDEKTAMEIYKTSMNHELAVFNDAYHDSIEAAQIKK